MIKCTVSATGSITRAAAMRTNRDNVSYISFTLKVNIKDRQGLSHPMYINVTRDGTEEELAYFSEGTRVSVSGTLIPRKQGTTVYYNLKSSSVSFSASDSDSLDGDMSFRGKVGKNITFRKDRYENDYAIFSAFSVSSVGEEAAFIWIRFMMFNSSPGEWFQPGCEIDVTGPFEVEVSPKGLLDMTCRVRTIGRWEREVRQAQQS